MHLDPEIHVTTDIDPGADPGTHRQGLIDLVAEEAHAHSDDVAELLLGFLVVLPDPGGVREPVRA